jgi:hypothetical protein
MERSSPSVVVFRVTVATAILTSVLGGLLPAYGFSGLDANGEELTSYSGVGAVLSPSALYWSVMATGGGNAVGLFGLLFFWGPARFILLGSLGVSVLLAPFSGVGIYSPIESFLAGAGSILSVWALSVSIWSPIAQRFTEPEVRP